MAGFEKLGVTSDIIKALANKPLEWTLPTDVQDEAIPLMLGGGDVMVAAVTGSGKTAAFGIPILQLAYEYLREKDKNTGNNNNNNNNLNMSIPLVTLSVHDKDVNCIINDEDKLSFKSQQGWNGCRANIAILNGRWYYEMNIISGLGRVGFGTSAATFNIGTDPHSYGYGGTGVKSHNRQWLKYPSDNNIVKFGPSDIIGVYINFNHGKIGFTKNGKDLGVAFNNNGKFKDALYPAACVKADNRGAGELAFNFGNIPFKYKPPTDGYKPLQQAKVGDTNLKYASNTSQKKQSKNSNTGYPLALILAPTRDLANQLFVEINRFKVHLENPKINSVLLTGGVSNHPRDVIAAHVVIGTCGMIVGNIQSNKISLTNCKHFVIDEADRVLAKKQGEQENVKAMYSRMPPDVQVCLFSATLHSDEIKQMSQQLCNNPTWVDLKGKEFVPETVHHCILAINPQKDRQWQQRDLTQFVITDNVHQRDQNIQFRAGRDQKLNELTYSEAVKILKPIILKKIIEAFKCDQCLIFCRTRLDCDNLEKYLTSLGGGRGFRGRVESGKENPFSCCVLHSGRSQNERKSNLNLFKEGECRFLICTDVAARGIDIKNLKYVINMTMPAESEDYIHRVGRVGRQEQFGTAISIISPKKEKVWYHSNCKWGKRNGVECRDTRMTTNGGCCIWYNELEIFNQVEKRLGNIKIPTLDQHNLDPKIIDKFVQNLEMRDPLMKEARQKVELLKGKVQELDKISLITQNDYLYIQSNVMDIVNKFRQNNNNNNNNRNRNIR